MTLDEAEKLARELLDDDTGGTSEREGSLARALLAVLPVVRAAEQFAKVYHQHPINQDAIDVVRAVDAMHTELSK